MEAHVKPGMVHLTAPEVKSWKRFETLDELHLPTDRPVRVLLFVHGTFSSTVGAFGVLAASEDGRGFLGTLISAYDAVIGFDHKTLSVDPKQNAEALLKRLKKHQPGSDFVIDVITHSRGGLVTRSFVEQVLPPDGLAGAPSTTSSSSRPRTAVLIWPTRSAGRTSSTSTPTWPWCRRRCFRCRGRLPSRRSSVAW